MGQILAFRPTDEALEAAWLAYERARDHAEAMDCETTTLTERCQAAMVAARLHRDFARLCARMDRR